MFVFPHTHSLLHIYGGKEVFFFLCVLLSFVRLLPVLFHVIDNAPPSVFESWLHMCICATFVVHTLSYITVPFSQEMKQAITEMLTTLTSMGTSDFTYLLFPGLRQKRGVQTLPGCPNRPSLCQLESSGAARRWATTGLPCIQLPFMLHTAQLQAHYVIYTTYQLILK